MLLIVGNNFRCMQYQTEKKKDGMKSNKTQTHIDILSIWIKWERAQESQEIVCRYEGNE